jgi:UDP-2,3-diacylglucosamine pyrophosphatase LpxH
MYLNRMLDTSGCRLSWSRSTCVRYFLAASRHPCISKVEKPWPQLMGMAADIAEMTDLVLMNRNRELSPTFAGRHMSIRGKVIGNLIRVLSGSNVLAQAYFIDYLIRNRMCRQGDVERLTPAVLEKWWNEPLVAWYGRRALAILGDEFRVEADKFLVSSLLSEWAMITGRHGIVISLSALVEKFLRLWSLRPTSPQTNIWLDKLTTDMAVRKRFGYHFRKVWAFQYNTLKIAKEMSSDDLTRKVFVHKNSSCVPFW